MRWQVGLRRLVVAPILAIGVVLTVVCVDNLVLGGMFRDMQYDFAWEHVVFLASPFLAALASLAWSPDKPPRIADVRHTALLGILLFCGGAAWWFSMEVASTIEFGLDSSQPLWRLGPHLLACLVAAALILAARALTAKSIAAVERRWPNSLLFQRLAGAFLLFLVGLTLVYVVEHLAVRTAIVDPQGGQRPVSMTPPWSDDLAPAILLDGSGGDFWRPSSIAAGLGDDGVLVFSILAGLLAVPFGLAFPRARRPLPC